VADDLRDRVLIEICAPCAFGKSILLRHIATKVRAWLGVPVVYHQMSGDDVDDLLQRLVRELYDLHAEDGQIPWIDWLRPGRGPLYSWLEQINPQLGQVIHSNRGLAPFG
jgi:hypothetical protein